MLSFTKYIFNVTGVLRELYKLITIRHQTINTLVIQNPYLKVLFTSKSDSQRNIVAALARLTERCC